VAISTIRALANAQIVQILDNNGDLPITQRRYKQEVASCTECMRLLRVLKEEVITANEEESGQFERNDDDVGYGVVYADLEQPLEKLMAWYGEVHTFNDVLSDVTRGRNEKIEFREVLLRSGDFLAFAQAEASPRSIGATLHGVAAEMSDMSTGLLTDQDVENQTSNDMQLQSLSGVILTSQTENFARALFRALRGLVITQFKQIEETITDPVTGSVVYKSAFTTFFHGTQALQRVTRIADGFAAHCYDVPTDRSERERMIHDFENEIGDMQKVIDETKRGKLQVLRTFYQQVVPIKDFVKQELVVYRTLNMFEQSPSGALLVADCWIPAYAADIVQKALAAGKLASNSTDDSLVAFMEPLEEDGKKQPTFIRTNRFTGPFQGIVNTYGTPRYREINPGFFALAMFPFLFGIMFGDMVHGLLLLLLAIYLIVFENSLANHDLGEIFQMIYGARYLLFMMGICALYMGLIYNEALSVAVSLFGPSAYASGEHFPDKPYVFGVDPIWRHSANLIQYTNSLKMKMSIIVGVSQMMFGIFLKLFNNIHFGRYVEAVVESVPEILFMGLTFGYMSGLIFLKWSIDYAPEPPPCFSSGCDGVIRQGYPLKAAPPAIIQVMIFMFKMEPLPPEYAMYPGQEAFQNFILTIAVCALPVLLFGKPLYLKRKMDAEAAAQGSTAGYAAVEDSEAAEHSHAEDDEEHNFGDIMVHQGIHTVEFALGCVSNTASYLRLWALSLAHSQLSEVFWEYILVGFEFSLFGYYPGLAGGWKALIPSYFVFFGCTIGILMMMESLSAFLHALRLQWVEFQTKFYAADGLMFAPLTFEDTSDTD